MAVVLRGIARAGGPALVAGAGVGDGAGVRVLAYASNGGVLRLLRARRRPLGGPSRAAVRGRGSGRAHVPALSLGVSRNLGDLEVQERAVTARIIGVVGRIDIEGRGSHRTQEPRMALQV